MNQTPLTDEEMDLVRRRAQFAEGTRWRCIKYRDIDKRIQIAPNDEPHALAWVDNDDTQHGSANARFIAHARTDIPRLLAEIDRLKAMVADVKAKKGGLWEGVKEEISKANDMAF